MGGLRGVWLFVMISILGPVAGLWFMQPARPVDGHAFEDPPFGDFVEITVDRLESLPWTIRGKNGYVKARYILGWIGERALLIEVDPEQPTSKTLRGEVHKLWNEPHQWVKQSPRLAGVTYEAILDVANPAQRTVLAIGGWIFTLCALVFWVRRYYVWRNPTLLVRRPLGAQIEAGVPRPDGLVAALMRYHGFKVYLGETILYAVTVMVIAGLVMIKIMGWSLTIDSVARDFGVFALGWLLAAPVSGFPMYWFVRRHRRALRDTLRDGELVETTIDQIGKDRLVVFARIGSARRCFRAGFLTTPAWVAADVPVRVLASAEGRWGLVIGPDGSELLAHRVGP